MEDPQFKDLLDKYLTDSLSETERKELSSLLDQPGYISQLQNMLVEEMSNRRFEGDGYGKVLALIEKNLISDIATMKNRKVFSLARWAAAAVVLALIAGSYFLIRKQPQRENTAVEQITEIQPGGNKAVLTLANGSKINLNAAAKGMVAIQGQTKVIKTNSGRLVYNATGKNQPFENGLNVLATPRGGTYEVQLPDGTEVWLNAASSITYPTAFTGKQRKVSITGEAYFDVAKDKTRPFHVSVNDMDMQVLGTRFNINAYADESDTKATLIDGSIKLTQAGKKINTILKPGDQARLDKNGNLDIVKDEDIDQVIAWKTGYFNFRNADLPTVMRQLQRWYDIKVEYKGDIPHRRFQGELPRNLELSKILIVLREMKIKYKIDDKTMTITN